MTEDLVGTKALDFMLCPVMVEVLREEMPAGHNAQVFNILMRACQGAGPARRDKAIVIHFTDEDVCI